MRKIIMFYLMAVFIFYSAPAFAQYGNNQQKDDDGSVPPGMEKRQMSDGVYILMQKGEKFHRPNQTVYVEESPAEYSARKYTDIDDRINRLEATNRELLEEIRYLESKLVLQESGADIDVSKSDKE